MLIGLWAWWAGLYGPYHFDDFVTPLNDPASQSLAAWREYLSVTLRPVTKLSYALEAEAGLSREPAPRRAASILLHAATAGLLFLLLVRLALQSMPRSAPLVAALLAALWFLHPVHADNVLLLSGRSAVLSGLFLLASLLALDRARPWLAGLLFVLACLSRETALAGLLPLLVLAASRPGASLRSTLREALPSLLGGALVLAWILTTPRYLHLAEFSFLGRPFWSSLAAQVGAVPVGLALLFQPDALSIDYGLALPRRPAEPLFLLGVAIYVTSAVGVFLVLKRSRAAAVGLALLLAALLPTQSVIPKLDPLTNRPLGLALAGLLLAAVPVFTALASQSSAPARWRKTGSVLALGICALLALATAERAALFQSELALWRDAASKSRTNERPLVQYAVLLKREKHDIEALQAILVAQRINPFNSQVAVLVSSFSNPKESK